MGLPGINSNSYVLINDNDVMFVDSEGSPASARSLMAGIKTITDKPIRYAVDTHFHIDHAYGNPAIPPDVEIIGHEFARRMLVGKEAREGTTFVYFTKDIPSRIENLKKQIAAESDPEKKAPMERQLAQQEASLQAYSGNFPLTPPNVTVRTDMTLYRGKREIRILYLGRGHTAGDILVYLPQEKALCSGDLFFKGQIGWQGDAFIDEQIETLEKIKALDVELVMPGHGETIIGKANVLDALNKYQDVLRAQWHQVTEMKKSGLTADQAASKLDLSAFKGQFRDAVGSGKGNDLYMVRRIYQVVDHQAIQ